MRLIIDLWLDIEDRSHFVCLFTVLHATREGDYGCLLHISISMTVEKLETEVVALKCVQCHPEPIIDIPWMQIGSKSITTWFCYEFDFVFPIQTSTKSRHQGKTSVPLFEQPRMDDTY